MMNLPAILVSAGCCMALMMVLIYSNSRSIRMAFYDDRLYYRLCYLVLILSGLDVLSTIVNGKTFAGAIGFNVIINSALFIGNYYFLIVWYQYIVYKLKGKVLKFCVKDLLPLSIPIFLIIVSAVNLFMPIIFRISDQNRYIRLPFTFHAFALVYVFLIYTVVMTFIYTRHGENRYFLIPVVLFCLPVTVGAIIQYHFYGISLIYITEAFGLTALYISKQNESSLLDSLTKLFNREYLTRYIKAFKEHNDGVKLLGGLMIDVNRFKEINDRFGHEEGDNALRNIAFILKSASGEHDLVSRYGGDEFVILCPVSIPKELEPLKQNILSELRKFNSKHGELYELSISIGSGVMDPVIDSPDDFMKLIDSRMYKDKDDYYRHMSID